MSSSLAVPADDVVEAVVAAAVGVAELLVQEPDAAGRGLGPALLAEAVGRQREVPGEPRRRDEVLALAVVHRPRLGVELRDESPVALVQTRRIVERQYVPYPTPEPVGVGVVRHMIELTGRRSKNVRVTTVFEIKK